MKRSERKIGGNPEFINDNEKWKQSILTNPAIVKINRVYKWTDIIEDPLLKNNFELAYKEFEQNKANRYKNGLEEIKFSSISVSRKLKFTYQFEGESEVSSTRLIKYSFPKNGMSVIKEAFNVNFKNL